MAHSRPEVLDLLLDEVFHYPPVQQACERFLQQRRLLPRQQERDEEAPKAAIRVGDFFAKSSSSKESPWDV